MDKFRKIKQYFVIIFYVVFLLMTTIYLHFENSKESSEKPNTITQEFVPELPSPTTEEGTQMPENSIIKEEKVDQFLDETSDFLDEREEKYANNIENIYGHHLIAENDFLRLFLNEENLSIILQDAKNGSVIYSTVEKPVKSNPKWESFVQSAISIEYLVDNNIVYNQVDMIQGKPEIKLIKRKDGFKAEIYYSELQIGLDLLVSLDDNQVLVEIPKESIIEESEHYKIGNVYVYPMLGYSKKSEVNGFMFIPDGSGATIRLDDNNGKYRQPYSEMIYGSNLGLEDPYVLSELYGMVTTEKPYEILYPVFGMIHENKQFGFVGIIEEGDEHARIEAYPSGAILPYNWITGKYIFRQFYTQATSQSSGTITQRQKLRNNIGIKTRYIFVSKDEADLFGMSKVYREYLIDKYQLVNKPSDFSVRLDFLGNDIEKGFFGYKSIKMSSFEEISEVSSDLTLEGVINQLIGLYGWQEKGESGSSSSKMYEISNLLGGMKGLNELITSLNDQSELYLHDHPLRYSEKILGINDSVLDKINRKPFIEDTGGKATRHYHYLSPEEVVSRLEQRIQGEYNRKNFVLSGIGQHIFSYYKNNNDYDRVHTRKIFEEFISQFSTKGKLSLKQPIQPYWKYIDSMVDVPLESSGYVFEDESVPFLSLVLRGLVPLYSEYINFESNLEEFILKLVETGVMPSYFLTIKNSSLLHNTNYAHVYTSMYADHKENIIKIYQELNEINEKLKHAKVSDYRKTNGLVKVEYDNSIVIYINHNDKTAKIDGIELKAKSYKVVDK
ncbi:hypothetical protein IU402_05230 [Aerococcaceae bacterium zg-BR9]|uniref:DUF5696 domain-containing protein n=1 Tax=Aerococcaceae bacterium zg-1292 TaxID=2774330 RepID=UPI004064BB56|nr:hypothetical protein [Aerococcaceae bacterium zg-BR9]